MGCWTPLRIYLRVRKFRSGYTPVCPFLVLFTGLMDDGLPVNQTSQIFT